MWQPIDRRDNFGRELHADRNEFLALGIVGALAGIAIEQRAVEAGEIELSRVLVFQLDQAAFGASVAE